MILVTCHECLIERKKEKVNENEYVEYNSALNIKCGNTGIELVDINEN